jgi:hypothetical protein
MAKAIEEATKKILNEPNVEFEILTGKLNVDKSWIVGGVKVKLGEVNVYEAYKIGRDVVIACIVVDGAFDVQCVKAIVKHLTLSDSKEAATAPDWPGF